MKLVNGDNLKKFEGDFARYLGVRYAYRVASGTDSLILGVIASNIGKGDEVILQSNGFLAAVEAIRLSGAKPVVVDIEEDSFGRTRFRLKRQFQKKPKQCLLFICMAIL